MRDIIKEFKKNKIFMYIFLFMLFTDMLIIFNIPIFRQVFGVIFLSLLPGYLILSILKLNNISFTKYIILCVGSSLSFLIFVGLVINNLAYNLGYRTPLDEIFLTLTLSLALYMLLFLLRIYTGATDNLLIPPYPRANNIYENISILFWVVFPCLSFVGAYLMRFWEINSVLMLGFISIISIIIVFTLFSRYINSYLFSISIFSMGVFITLAFSLRSAYIVGADVHGEYYLFRLAIENLHWTISNYSALDACLSISLLPAIFKQLLGINDTPIFYKVFYSIIVALTPLAVFEIAKKYLDDVYAFIAAVFFFSSHVFMWTGANPRTNLAIFFFSLAIMVLGMDIDPIKKRVLLILFILSTLMSHYSTTYIFFFVLLMVWIVEKNPHLRFKGSKNISIILIILFFASIFCWYSQVTKGAFDYSAIGFFKTMAASTNDILILDSRGGALPEVCGQGFQANSVPRQLHIIFQWIVMLLIGIGLLKITTQILPTFGLDKRKCFDLDSEYGILAIACFGILAFCVIEPAGSISLGTDRAYFQTMVVLSLEFVIGCNTFSRYIKINNKLLILFVLIPYFASGTGISYQLYDDPREPTFTSNGNLFNSYYIKELDLTSAKWIYRHKSNYTLYTISDIGPRIFRDVSVPGSELSFDFIERISNINNKKGYVYLDQSANLDKIIIVNNRAQNISDYPNFINRGNILYENGGSAINLLL